MGGFKMLCTQSAYIIITCALVNAAPVDEFSEDEWT